MLMRTLYVLENTRPPFDTSHVLAVNLPVMTYGRTPQQVQDFYREVQRRVSALPGVLARLDRLQRSLARRRGLEYHLYLCVAGRGSAQKRC